MKHWKSIMVLSLSLLIILTACVPPTQDGQSNVSLGTITDPVDKSQVSQVISVSGTVKNLPAGSKVWIVVFLPSSNRYYPQDKAADVMTDGKWTTQVTIGNPGDHGLEAKIYMVAADSSAQEVFTQYLLTAAQKNHPGIDVIPDSALRLTMINVTRE